MRDRCADYWEGIVDIAEGRQSEPARLHLQSCGDCSEKLEQLHVMMAAGDLRYFDAPTNLIASVKGLMPQPERRVFSLLRSTTAWTGARTAAHDFQLVAGDGDTQVRLMFSKVDDGWEVMGRIPAGSWSVEADGQTVDLSDEGRFSFLAPGLDATGFTLIGSDTELVVPSAEELLSNEPHGSD
jgi:hypothetical protein